MTIPNMLTLLRLFLTPVIIALLFVNIPYAKWAAVLLFVVAGLTDVFDGIIAKKLDQKTHFGSFMDPMVDKIMINSLFITLLALQIVPLWTVLLMVAREFAVQVIRDAAKAGGKILRSEWSGKIKADLQGITIFISLFSIAYGIGYMYAEIAMIITLAVSYYALFEFLFKNRTFLKKWM
ncbi:MAG: CDP-diacylglycerol--glycerol-3-phosphate 3-phosphatidyltransferase [Candidatus Aenigmarchaeota archaeon]|nr:CDP-diacylglycerol--glycerol-3-phosphate 3-phosphatidyltransferase [Candidatus Aenigmarchaeota archaeon]